MIDLSPETFRALGYQAVDLIVERLAALPELPVRQLVPLDLREQLMHSPLPDEGTDAVELLNRVAEQVLPYPMGNSSGRFFAWVNSPPAPLGILADLLASAHDPSVAGGDHAATYVEHGVLNWIKSIFSFPEESGAILTSGGSTANLIPLAVMRHVKSTGEMRAQGFQGESAPMVIYTSSQGHSCVQKAVELLGFGSDYLRKIPVDADFCMDIGALEAQIAADRAAGLRPVCVAASAGTVNTGAIDPLDAIANLCEREDLWFHIDGAYGGFGILAEQTAGLYKGIERADSLAVDPHKWLYVPVECGCAIVRDAQAMRDTFSLLPPYLRDDRALPWFAEFGIQQTRGFKALKLWMTLQQIGLNGYKQLISRDVALAQTLREKICARPDFELIAAGPLSVTCFCYAPPDTADLDALNRRLLERVQAEGRAFLSATELNGRYALRACIVNFRTTKADLDVLLDAIADAGKRL
ncbi:MAG: pyridoxal-dependent decarboxylase [Chloroflexota bacterium]